MSIQPLQNLQIHIPHSQLLPTTSIRPLDIDFASRIAPNEGLSMRPVRNFFVHLFEKIVELVRRIIDFAKLCFQKIGYFFSGKTGVEIPPGLNRNPSTPFLEPISVVANEVPFEMYQGLAINPFRLPDVPEAIDPELVKHIAQNAVPPIEKRQILEQFDAIFQGVNRYDTLFIDEGRDVPVYEARDRIASHLVDCYNQMGLFYQEAGYRERVSGGIDVFLCGMIFELRKEEVPLEKKQELLKNLASCALHCPPRRHEQCKKAYLVISNQIETLDNILVGLMQQAKEDLFLNHYSLSTEPVMTLNKIRSEVGRELGLDTNPINLQDPHIGLANARYLERRAVWGQHNTADDFRGAFREIFTPQNALFLMKKTINERIVQDEAFACELSQFIANRIGEFAADGTLSQAEVDALPMPYQYDYDVKGKGYQVTDEGVRFLLVHFNFLNQEVENGHLVRAEPEAVAAS